MKMKRMFCVLCGVLLIIHAYKAIADAGSAVTLSGEVKASPCTVDDSTKSVDLGTYYVSTMGRQGEFIKFSLTLSSCPAGTSYVKATFSGNPDASSPEWYYANTTATGAATGIHIELASDAASPAGLGNGKTMTVNVSDDRKAEFKLQTRVNKDNDSPMPGIIQTIINVTYEYS